MKLVELVSSPENLSDDEAAIYAAQPWAPNVEAALVSPAPRSTEAIAQDGIQLHYFLETFIARDVLDTVKGTDLERCRRLIAYAINDA